ncbi:MAG: DUF4870 domain-containing protein, partial [Bryobacteraceae bacterium]
TGAGGNSNPGGAPHNVVGDNVASAVCYVPLIGAAVMLLIEPYSRNKAVRFHAFQSLFLLGVVIVLRYIPDLFDGMRVRAFATVIDLATTLIWLYMMLRTYQGKKVVLPVIGPLAEQQA